MSRTSATLPNRESAWNRFHRLPELDDAYLRARLGDWPWLLRHRPEVLGGGLRSLNLRFGDVVARLALAQDHDVRKEAALLDLVGSRVRVPGVVAVADRAILLEYVDTQPLPATEVAGFAVGTCLAEIHSHRFATAGLLDAELQVSVPFTSATSALTHWAEEISSDTRRSASGTDSPAPGTDTAVQLWKEHAARLETIADAPVLVHSDFKPANIRWSPSEQRAVVFDWDFAWAGPNLFDIGQLFRWNPPLAFSVGFEQGYRSKGGALPADWHRAGELFDLLNLVDLLNRGSFDIQRDHDVTDRIMQTCRRHE